MADTNEFRHALRRERLKHGMSQDALGAEVFVSGSQIGNYEAGRSVPPDEVAAGLDRSLDTGDEMRRLAKQARGEAVAPWLRPWKVNEERAILIRTFEHSVIPGLLQTEAYARAIIAAGPNSEVQVEQMTRDRLERQAATLGRPNPVTLTALIGEPALRYIDPTVMKDQLKHLIAVGSRPNVHIRVVPLKAGLHAGLTGAFALATLPDGSQVAYLDDLVEGRVPARMKDVQYAIAAWESINARALPWDLSRDLILKAIDEHEEHPNVEKKYP